MKTSLLAILVLATIVLCGTAGAADWDWTGYYAGLNAGAVANNSHYRLSPTGLFLTQNPAITVNNPLRTDSGDFEDPAFTGGGQVGYNRQFDWLVVGFETDFNYNGVDESEKIDRALASPLVGRFIHTVKQEVDFFGTVRGRLGFTPASRWLVYGTGGLAYGRVRSSSDVLFTAGGDRYVRSSSAVRAGWAAGAGAEYAFMGNWSAKLEYLHVDLGRRTYEYGNQLFPGFNYSTDLDTREHIVRIGINFKFQ
jgi:outer membrane immunogenic protein